ncbi:ABC transporter permease [Nocardiopsis lambiniae]|uniref:ABC-2 family transporter protein n=1 Tax=Nocardiopsis lambiniae TaxID=3075539 RepID=A0ABU2MAU3_9ACTN|nr:ABC-2 family transporter protein [Nocardiopsis sp. DSM 44743]MDT0329791.1 ABC-2 family transporter protein [Nocardiopsis sp. DSM 44743]
MRVYPAVYIRGLRRYSTYRAATIAGILTNSVFGCINAAVLIALFSVRPEINGYDMGDAVTQVFVCQALIATVAVMGPPLDLGERIRTGAVGVDLLRPVSLMGWWLSEDLGRATFSLVFRGTPTFLVGTVLFDLVLPKTLGHWALVLASCGLAAIIGFALRYLYELAGFWILDTRGIWAIVGMLGPVAAGMLLPLALYPPAVSGVLRALPWASTIQIPAEILLGKESLPGGSVAGGLALQAGWALGLLLLGAWITSVATRKVVVQGG